MTHHDDDDDDDYDGQENKLKKKFSTHNIEIAAQTRHKIVRPFKNE